MAAEAGSDGPEMHQPSAGGGTPSEEPRGRAAVVAALAANVAVAGAKIFGFVLTGSGAMLAEAIHSIADTGNEGILIGGMHRARRRPDARHPFGYGSFRFLGGFVVAAMLFGVGAGFSVAEAIDKLVHPHPLGDLTVDLVIVVVAAGFEALSFRNAVKTANTLRTDQGWWGFVRSTPQPEVAVLLIEDTSALIGLLLAGVSVGLSALTGSPLYDALGSLAIGCVLAFNAVVLGVEMTSLLVGESADPRQLALVAQGLSDTAGVERVIHVRAVHVGPDELLVAAKVTFTPGMTAEEAAAVVDEAEVAVRGAVPAARWIYVEPGRH